MTDRPPEEVLREWDELRVGREIDTHLVHDLASALRATLERMRAFETDKWIDLHSKAATERDALRAKLDKAEAVVEAAANHGSDHSRLNEALAAWDAHNSK